MKRDASHSLHHRAASTMAVRRRTVTEQKVLRMVRGACDDAQPDAPSFHSDQFGRLRALATRNDLAIQAPEVPFLSFDELRLLGWLAQAQRVASYARPFHRDTMLTLTVVHCAGTLDALGIRLPVLARCGDDVAGGDPVSTPE